MTSEATNLFLSSLSPTSRRSLMAAAKLRDGLIRR
jgi:hypothetical protein